MKHSYMVKWIFILATFFTFTSCEKEDSQISPANPTIEYANVTSEYLQEGFENASKTSYASASVTLASGSWMLNDALIGNTSSDPKLGLQSARVRNSGKLTMEFDLVEGAKSVSLSYAKYGKDKSSELEVYYSTNSGSTWTMAGNRITVNSSSLQTSTFTLDVQGNVRFEVRKVDGTTTRANIDEVVVTPNPVAPVNTIDIFEDYESGSKGSYAAGSVTLASGSWNLSEALIGTLEGDRKTGTKSVRIRDLGILAMEFDVQGAKTITLNHAVYGTDASSTWQLQASTDGGNTWATQGNTITSSSTTLQSVTFSVDFTGNVRFRVVKLSGSGARINIDDFKISGTTEPGNGGGPGPGGEPVPGDTGIGGVHLTFGNPSGAVTDVNQPNNYLLRKAQYVMSYSRDKGTANWVSWHLDGTWIGSTPRQDDFRADNTLPSGWFQVGSTSYSGSGFDRGHMCPSADRTLTVEDNSSTFFMTNMIPQSPKNNQTGWASLESYCRSLISGGFEVYIISGGYGVGGTGSAGYATTIAGGMVTVPSNTWKVVLIIPQGDDDVNRVTTSTRVIAIDMPNDQSITSDWRAYRTSIDAIEAKTGYDFFSLLNDSVENTIEATIDTL